MDGTDAPAVAPMMCTYSGKRFNPIDPVIEDISIIDIAHALSNVCRYGGQCKEFYSVAQHSVICSWESDGWLKGVALLHDASEGYLGDIIAPLKQTEQYAVFRKIEDNLMSAIFQRFDLDINFLEDVHDVDLLVRHTEMRDFGSIPEEYYINEPMLPYIIKPLPPAEAKILFLKEFSRLFGYGTNGWRYFS